MRMLFSLALLLIASTAFAQESLPERLSQVEANMNAVNAMLTAQKAQIENLQSDVTTLIAKVDALAKAQNVRFASKSDWAGDATWSTGTPTAASGWSSSSAMYSGSYMMSSGYGMSRSRPGLFGRVLRGGIFRGGGCASGN